MIVVHDLLAKLLAFDLVPKKLTLENRRNSQTMTGDSLKVMHTVPQSEDIKPVFQIRTRYPQGSALIWLSCISSVLAVEERERKNVKSSLPISVVGPDPVGSETFSRIRILIWIRENQSGLGSSGSVMNLTALKNEQLFPIRTSGKSKDPGPDPH